MRSTDGIALSLALGLALGLAPLAGCGGSAVVGPGPGDHAIVPLAEVTARLEVRRLEGKPALAVVAREGDPTAALAAVLLVDDAAIGAAPALAAVLEDRLRDRGAAASVARGAIVLTWDASGSAAAALRAFAAATSAPITTSPALARRAATLAGVVPPRGLEAAARCSGAAITADGAAAADLGKPDGAAAAEALRATVATAARVSLAIVGAPTVVEDAARDLAAQAAWATGSAAGRTTPADVGLAVLESEGPAAALRRAGDPDLVISLELPRAAAAPTIARTLGDTASPLSTQLALLAPRFAIVEAGGVARAGAAGSCLRLDLRARRPDALDADAVGHAVRIVRSAAIGPASRDEAAAAARSIVTAGDAREAAARAAWWTTASDGVASASAPTFVAVAQRAGSGAPISADAARRALDRDAGAARPPVERRVRHEPGQGAFVVAIGSPCPAALDVRTHVDSAALALGLVATARERAEHGVELTPFIGPEGAGLVARGEALRGEDGGALATRVTRALAAALGARPPPIAEVERARARLVERAALEWGHPEASEALIHAMAPERPLALAPLGLEPALVRAEAAAAAASPADILAGPLRIAVLSNVDPSQAERAVATLGAHLPPTSPAPCSASVAAVPAAGRRIDVRVAGDERFAQLALGLGLLSVEAAEVAISILQVDDGEVARAAAAVGASVRVRRVGPDVLVDVRVAPERTEEAFAALRGALDRVARSEIDEVSARRVADGARARLRARVADPIGRAIALWSEGSVVDRGASDPRSIAPRLAAASWVFVVARPS